MIVVAGKCPAANTSAAIILAATNTPVGMFSRSYFFAEHFPYNECDYRHKEQPQRHFLYDAAVHNGCNHTTHGQSCGISRLNAVNHTAEYPVVKAEYYTSDYGDYKRDNQASFLKFNGFSESYFIRKNITEETTE